MVEGTYIFDCEVFAHDWLFVFKEVATGEYTVIWNTRFLFIGGKKNEVE